MSMKVSLAGMLAIALSLPLAADELSSNQTIVRGGLQKHCPRETEPGELALRRQPASALPIIEPGPEPLGDIFGGRGPNPHLRELADIAIHESTGNKDAAEIVARGLRKFGVTREEMQSAINSIKLHDGSAPEQPVEHRPGSMTDEARPAKIAEHPTAAEAGQQGSACTGAVAWSPANHQSNRD